MCRLVNGAVVALVLLLPGCAKRTRDIRPAVVDPFMFAGATCSDLVTERAKRSQALVFAGLEQDHVAEEDRKRALGAPTPMGTIFDGDNEPEVARLKGELRAIGAQMSAMNCGRDYR